MARKKKRPDATESGELDMTPMIDIVFNLLVFFMVITDLTQKDLVELTLPIAYMAQEDKADEEDDRIILNVDKFGQIIWRSQRRTLGELRTILAAQKSLYQRKQKRKGKEAFKVFPNGAKATKLYVLLRADKDTPWQHVQWLMTVMAQEQFYKLQFATSKFLGGKGWAEGEQKKLGGISQKEYKARTEGGQ